MTDLQRTERRRLQQLTRPQLVEHQLARLNSLLGQLLPANSFYADKLREVAVPIRAVEELADWPTTTKDELLLASDADPTANLTFPLADYTRVHRTSGTRGRPLLVYDTAADWDWWLGAWQFVLDAAEVTRDDCAFMAFSFGPFIGFWSAYDALIHRGALVVPSGGLSTKARLDLLEDVQATVVCCTPTYALRMAESAAAEGRDLARNTVRALIVAGEPGGSLPAVRHRMEASWGATVHDHSGATEVGPWGFGSADGLGIHVNESDFIAEFLPHDNELGAQELVLTNLGRVGWPVIRYRTGDLVVPHVPQRGFLRLEGGVLARADEMVVIRGVNVFPSAIEETLRQFPEIEEFRTIVFRDREMDALRIEIEGQQGQPQRIAEAIHRRLGLRVDVTCLPAGTLPRFESKSRRFVDQR